MGAAKLDELPPDSGHLSDGLGDFCALRCESRNRRRHRTHAFSACLDGCEIIESCSFRRLSEGRERSNRSKIHRSQRGNRTRSGVCRKRPRFGFARLHPLSRFGKDPNQGLPKRPGRPDAILAIFDEKTGAAKKGACCLALALDANLAELAFLGAQQGVVLNNEALRAGELVILRR